mmetsp:Transcript_45199/g.117095  ORF Transcript_45199/g.117095 Transcript_45199/m.117095 type:complete len:461 (+) Transcript_45199:70-1452(+)
MADEFEGGELVVTGGTDWAHIGRTGGKKTPKEKAEEAERAITYPNLDTPHRVKNLMGIKIRFVASGSAACHSIIGDMSGKCYTWGRNEKGQLGHGDVVVRNMPTVVSGLADKEIVGASAGKNHSVVVASDGTVWAFGSNSYGQLGTGSCRSSPKDEELKKVPVACTVPKCDKVAAGAEFTMFLCNGELFACGLPQYGQLGNGTTGEYNTSASSIKMAFSPYPLPTRVLGPLASQKVVDMACGHNHTCCSDTEGNVYTWGFGGFGRLGHNVQQDETLPRQVEVFKGRVKGAEKPVVACGSVSTFITSNLQGTLYSWGRMKASGDNTMYPKPFSDLQGWNIRTMACGNLTYVVGSDKSAITWGQAQHQELGYGPKGRKTAAVPDKCMALEGFTTHDVGAGYGHILFLVTGDKAKLDELPVWENDLVEEAPAAKGPKGAAAGAKRKAEAAKGGRGRGRGRGKK